ncbi:hypothetical protein B0H11DRAFT_2254476 [Mycena galericulata]|nr:hypothetical protein B0H11DRAFT_2254476 [Mycena galericulata]
MASETPAPTTFDLAAATALASYISANSAFPSATSSSALSSSSVSSVSAVESTNTPAATGTQPILPAARSTLPTGAVIGIILGTFSILSLAILLVWLRRRHQLRQQNTYANDMSASTPNPYPVFFPDLSSAIPINHIDTTDNSDARSITKVRREYLRNELRAAQEKIIHIQNLERRPSSTRGAGRIMRLLSGRRASGAGGLPDLVSELRDKNEMLTARIHELETQMESPWALGLSDEPPPGYTDERS